MNFNHYYTNNELEAALKEWSSRFPQLCRLVELGKSYENRPVWLLAVTQQATGPDTEKPAVWLDGNIHATELAGTTTVLKIIDSLLEGYAGDDQIHRLLDTCVFYTVPRINPDGAEKAMAADPRFLRSGVRPYPWQELQPGLHEQDIDGNGLILQMRIPDPNGDWKIYTEDPRLMQKRAPEEQGGQYYRILPEGLIENYDGDIAVVAPPHQGLDFNRNFPFNWRTEGEQRGAGNYPASEVEIRAVVDFVSRHPNINAALTFHTFSRVILRSYSTKPDSDMIFNDLWLLKKIGEIGTRASGYPCYSTYHDFLLDPKEITTGAFDDWMYDQFGVISYTVELWDVADEAGVKKKRLVEWFQEHPIEDDQTVLKWIDEHVGPEGFINWYPYQHPQLGPVELGGWNTLYTWRNPPKSFMGSEAAKHVPFALALGELLPRLSFHKVEARRLGDKTWRVVVVVDNSGFLPTYTTQQSRQKQAVRPVRAAIKLSGSARLAGGKPEIEIGHLEGRSNKGGMFMWDHSPMDNRGKAEWLVEAEAGSSVDISITSERAGVIRKKIILE